MTVLTTVTYLQSTSCNFIITLNQKCLINTHLISIRYSQLWFSFYCLSFICVVHYLTVPSLAFISAHYTKLCFLIKRKVAEIVASRLILLKYHFVSYSYLRIKKLYGSEEKKQNAAVKTKSEKKNREKFSRIFRTLFDGIVALVHCSSKTLPETRPSQKSTFSSYHL